ncbi:hypothetical protein C8R48DRAFT_703277 [Suillus tomentosus]|nr:hypothetical protein C8R48DRAFT_703277 [Suillus tomentosus]
MAAIRTLGSVTVSLSAVLLPVGPGRIPRHSYGRGTAYDLHAQIQETRPPTW